MIEHIDQFTPYFESIRQRTLKYIRTIPPDQVDWSPGEGEFTCGDIVRHLAATEQMFVGAVVTGQWGYAGHDRSASPDLEMMVAHLETIHGAALAALQTLSHSALYEPRPTLNGPPMKAWRLLMAMVEHEIHHRSQLAMYLSLMGITPPHLYGLGVEDVIARVTT